MPPRSKAAPRGESRTGLIVALVFFILTTITLGVVAYMGYDGQKELEGKVSAAQDDAKKANEAMNEFHAKWEADQLMMGKIPADKGEALGQLNANKNFAAEIADIRAFYQAYGVDWDDKTAAPTVTILTALKNLTQQNSVAESNTAKALEQAEATRKDYVAKAETLEAKANTALKAQATAADDAVKQGQIAQEAKNTAKDELKSWGEKYTALMDKQTNNDNKLNGDIKRLQEINEGARETLGKFQRDQDARRAQLLLTDKVVGKVTHVDGVSGTAYINLGSADFVRPGMTFSILEKYDASKYGAEDSLPKKATLVVNQVVTEHSSRASIEFDPRVNPIHDPVEVGEALYKPGWKPGTPVRWALAGHFDLNGLGRDETLLLKNRLQKEGIIVDAYLDLNTLKVVGDLNHSIDYLIVGSRPTGETARIVGEERKKAIEDAMNGMIESAKTMGITVMQGRVFLPVFGIDLPRNRALPLFPGGAGGAPAANADKDKADKKDEGK